MNSGTIDEISTVGELSELVSRLVDAQVDLGVERRVAPNETTLGDSKVRSVFYTLLPTFVQRLVFLRVAGKPRAWPRLRGIFGAPPYAFLFADDAVNLRAAGIARGRVNIASDQQNVCNYTQFGAGQLIDEQGREYRSDSRNFTHDSPLPWRLDEFTSREILLQVRVKKRDRATKFSMSRNEVLKKCLTFPIRGELVLLRETKGIPRFFGRPARHYGGQDGPKAAQDGAKTVQDSAKMPSR